MSYNKPRAPKVTVEDGFVVVRIQTLWTETKAKETNAKVREIRRLARERTDREIAKAEEAFERKAESLDQELKRLRESDRQIRGLLAVLALARFRESLPERVTCFLDAHVRLEEPFEPPTTDAEAMALVRAFQEGR